MKTANSTSEDYDPCSSFIRHLVQQSGGLNAASFLSTENIPKRIVQFWDNLDRLPLDVNECIKSWEKVKEQGIERIIFNKEQAGNYIYQTFGLRHKQAYDKCYHPAMQSDFFRLCYIFAEGGCYIDADDEYNGSEIEDLFRDGRLKIQPLCYDTTTHTMVPPSLFTKPGMNVSSWIFYFNNNPLIAKRGHVVLKLALERATSMLEKDDYNSLPEIQSTTGPGNLTKSIFDVVSEDDRIKHSILVLSNWEDIAESKWELSYRKDARNWRISNQQGYTEF